MYGIRTKIKNKKGKRDDKNGRSSIDKKNDQKNNEKLQNAKANKEKLKKQPRKRTVFWLTCLCKYC